MHPSPRVRLTRGADLGWGTGVLGPQAPTPCALFRVGSLRCWHLALSCTWVNQGKRLSCFPFSDLRALLFAACRIWSLPRTPPQPLSAPCGLVLTPPPLPPARPAPRRPHPRPKPRQPTVQGEGRTQPLPLPQFLCTVIAILLHYVYMSTFAWTFVESLHVYRMLTEVRNIDAGPMRFYYVVGWGIPAIVTGEHAQSGHARPGTRGTSQEPTSVPPGAGRGALWPRPGHLAPTSAHRSVITQCPCQV